MTVIKKEKIENHIYEIRERIKKGKKYYEVIVTTKGIKTLVVGSHSLEGLYEDYERVIDFVFTNTILFPW